MDLSFTPEEERYRTWVREFLKDNLPQGWGTPGYELPKGRALVELLREWPQVLEKVKSRYSSGGESFSSNNYHPDGGRK